MHIFKPASECELIKPILHFSHYFCHFEEIILYKDNTEASLDYIYVIIDNDFKYYPFKETFLKDYQSVCFEIKNDFFDYDIKILKLAVSKQVLDISKIANFSDFDFFKRSNAPEFYSDLTLIEDILRTKQLLKNF